MRLGRNVREDPGSLRTTRELWRRGSSIRSPLHPIRQPYAGPPYGRYLRGWQIISRPAPVGGRNAPSRTTRALYGDGDVASKPLKPLFSNTLLSFAATRPLTHAPACRFAATHWGMVLPLRGHSLLPQSHQHNMHISLSNQDILGSMHSSTPQSCCTTHKCSLCSAITCQREL